MKMRWALGAALAALALTAATVAPTAAAGGGIWYVGASTTLTADYHGQIVITADYVTLDCAGNPVTAPTYRSGVGIEIDNRTGVTIKNCATTGFDIGFFLVGASANTLTGNSATDTNTGFFIVSSSSDANDNVLRANTANGNGSGFNMSGWGTNPVSGTLYENNVANGNAWFGFGAWRATSNSWKANTANDNGHWGVALWDQTWANTLSNNSATGNGESGFWLTGETDNTLTRNSAIGNGDGFVLHGEGNFPFADDNTLHGNVATNNEHNGFKLNHAAGNSLTSNIANDNHELGFLLVGGSSYNTLKGNTANTEGWTGFGISDGSSYNHFESNVAVGSLTGFWIEGISGNAPVWNTFTANKATGNQYNGFAVSDGASHTSFTGDTANGNTILDGFGIYNSATYTTVTGCSAHGNGLWDAADETWAPQTNTWTNNNFGTTFGLG